jgi:hypothetical protein
MKLIDLHWNELTGEGFVKCTKAFNEAHIVVQLDMLQDCIVDLINKYDQLLQQPESEKNKSCT